MKSPSSRRRVATLLALALAVAIGGSWWILSRSRPGNILLIVVDTLRADALGCYGSRNKTPRIDALAAAGRRYDPVVGSFHQTSASMGSMFTGLVPSIEDQDGQALPWNGRTWCGMYRFGTGDADSQCLPASRPTFPERLKAAGYRTIGVTANNLLFRPAGFDRGFDSWTEVGMQGDKPEGMSPARFGLKATESRSAKRVTGAALAAIEESPSGPIFLYVHYMGVHDWWTFGVPGRGPRNVANYAAAVEKMDASFGLLLDSLRQRGFLKDATVLLTADHGESLLEPHPVASLLTHLGNPTYEPVARIPLIVVQPPGRSPRGAAFDRAPLLRTQDLYDVVLSMAGQPVPERVSELEDDECFYTEMFYRTLRRGKWKITCPRGTTPPTKCLTFDLSSDPLELIDVTAGQPDVVRRLTARMAELTERLGPATGRPEAGEMSEQDRERLRVLGYLE